MFMIYWVEGNRYYHESGKKHWVDTAEQASQFTTVEAAMNVAKNSIKVGPLEYVDCEKDQITLMTKEEAKKTYEELERAIETLSTIAVKIPNLKQYYQTAQGELDKQQEDLLHKFEFMAPGNIMFVKFGRMLKRCREERRRTKNRINYLIALSQSSVSNIPQVLKEHTNKTENCIYTPRALPEIFTERELTE